MLKNIKNDLLYLLGILNSIAKIKLYSDKYLTPDDLFNANDQLNFNACLNLLTNIGENANKISNELKNKYQKIEWYKIVGFRNRIVHDYQNIDILTTCHIIKIFLTTLEEDINKIIESELKSGNFDKEEYNTAKISDFYKYINFNNIKA